LYKFRIYISNSNRIVKKRKYSYLTKMLFATDFMDLKGLPFEKICYNQ